MKKTSVSLVICRLQMIFIQLLAVTGLFFLCFLSAIPKRWYKNQSCAVNDGEKRPISIDRSILDLHT